MKKVLAFLLSAFILLFDMPITYAVYYDYTVNCIADQNGNIVTSDNQISQQQYQIISKTFIGKSENSGETLCIGELKNKSLTENDLSLSQGGSGNYFNLNKNTHKETQCHDETATVTKENSAGFGKESYSSGTWISSNLFTGSGTLISTSWNATLQLSNCSGCGDSNYGNYNKHYKQLWLYGSTDGSNWTEVSYLRAYRKGCVESSNPSGTQNFKYFKAVGDGGCWQWFRINVSITYTYKTQEM